MSARKPQPGERICAECDGEGHVEVEVHGGPTAREEPDTRLVECEECDGTGVARCGGCGETQGLDAAGLCPSCVDENVHGRAPDAAEWGAGNEPRHA